MKCPKCGEENDNDAKFCRKCGQSLSQNTTLNNSENKNKLIIIVLVAVIAILGVGLIFGSGILKSEVPLEKQDFEVFTMDVPVGAQFEVRESFPDYAGTGGFIFLENVGDYSKEVFMIEISTVKGGSVINEFTFDRREGDVVVYKDRAGNELYYAIKKIGRYEFSIMGGDSDTLVKMLNSVEITDENGISSQSTSSSSSNTQTPSSSTSSSSIKILGGSFSTGSAEEDKTYARINVGTAHAGKNVVVQIFYSRDGSSLNNGNMVPATVHSDGYLEIASADAYHYYPDHATIKIYDTNNNLLDSKSVSLSPTSGTQTF